MSDLPVFSAQGKTDSEKLAELIKFMPSLSSAIDRQMSSLDFNNLNESLRKRIEDSVTEHQDLSEYATRAHTWRVQNGLSNEIQSLSDEIQSLSDEIKNLKSKINELFGRVEDLESKVG